MSPLPKRKHSKARKGRRMQVREAEKTFLQLVACPHCDKKKLPHRVCKYCNK